MCFTRDKDDDIKFDIYGRYVYCDTCLTKIKYHKIYIIAHCMNKTHVFCSRQCYGRWLSEK